MPDPFALREKFPAKGPSSGYSAASISSSMLSGSGAAKAGAELEKVSKRLAEVAKKTY